MNPNKKIVPYGKCKFCGTTHRFLKTCCPAFRYVCQRCNEENHYEQFCPINKKEGKTNGVPNRPVRVNNPQPKATCLFCGESHPPDMSVCPAIGKFCCNCGQPNHTEKVCPQKMGIPQMNSPQNKVPSPKCGFCQKPNHSERTCRNKNREEQNKNKNSAMTKKFGSSKSINFDARMKHCNFCGDEHSVVKGSCPAYGQRCTYCKREHHVEKACEVRIRDQKKKLGEGNVFNSFKSSKSTSMVSLNIPMSNEQVDETVDEKTETKEDKENKKENGQEKGVNQQKKFVSQKKQPVRKKQNPPDSSDSDNDDEELNEKKAKKLLEVASYYVMWQEYPQAKDYLIKAKLLSHLPEVDEKLAEITKLMSSSNINS